MVCLVVIYLQDARWVDDDRHRKRAEQRRQAIQEKQDELVRKKEEKKLLLQHEDEEIYKSLHKPKGKDKPGNIKKVSVNNVRIMSTAPI